MVIFQFANCKCLPEGTYLYPRPICKTGWHQMFFHPKVLLGIWSHPLTPPALVGSCFWKENAETTIADPLTRIEQQIGRCWENYMQLQTRKNVHPPLNWRLELFLWPFQSVSHVVFPRILCFLTVSPRFPRKCLRSSCQTGSWQRWLLGMKTTGQTPRWKTAFVVDVY